MNNTDSSTRDSYLRKVGRAVQQYLPGDPHEKDPCVHLRRVGRVVLLLLLPALGIPSTRRRKPRDELVQKLASLGFLDLHSGRSSNPGLC